MWRKLAISRDVSLRSKCLMDRRFARLRSLRRSAVSLFVIINTSSQKAVAGRRQEQQDGAAVP